MEKVVYSVYDINRYIKSVLTNDEMLKFIYVKGEISNFKKSGPGHIYFSLKDKDSLINAVMFSSYASRMKFEPKNGDEVTVLASIDTYVPRGSYQLMVYEISLKGQGTILEELEKLKKKLASEGLFDESRKRPINLYPSKIGIITARNSAAIKDLTYNIFRRYPLTEIYFFPSSVQGENAPKELLEAFNKSQQYDLDTLIIGRGGGANEDLNAFNDEALVRAVSSSKMPVIAAVGHEIDSTLIDYVADKRASTPTGAAELATIDIREIEQRIDDLNESLKDLLEDKLIDIKEEVELYQTNLKNILLNKVEKYKIALEGEKRRIIALNPSNILSRGYSMLTSEDGHVITSIKEVKEGSKIINKLMDGEVISTVEEIKNGQ